jgi:hypothetical protein
MTDEGLSCRAAASADSSCDEPTRMGDYNHPPYTEAEEAELYRRMD